MLPDVSLPVCLTAPLSAFRGCFTAPTFATFTALVAGFVRQTGAHTVCGMLIGAGLERAWHHTPSPPVLLPRALVRLTRSGWCWPT
jgi:hypothetical protein